jgi:HD-like signal output (HDOD) protein
MLSERQKQWGVDQWAAFLTTQTLPCMARSKMALRAFEEEEGDELSAADLSVLALGDPYLCLRLLREAESRRSHRLGHDTTTALGAVMQLGVRTFRNLLLGSPETDDQRLGLLACSARAVLASQIARMWGRARGDIAPDEVAMAALLAEIGELLLWHYAPELPESALHLLHSGQASRSAMAQEQACGFRFRELSLKCATVWALPPLLIQLIRGMDNVRANLCKLYLDTARHLATAADDPALPDDLAAAKRLIPHASLDWLASHMNGLDEEKQARLIESAQWILDCDNGQPEDGFSG